MDCPEEGIARKGMENSRKIAKSFLERDCWDVNL